MKRFVGVLASAALAAVLAQAADASTIVVGASAPDQNCFPFGCNIGPTIPQLYGKNYQQVYAASNFSGPFTIAGLTFYNHNVPGGTPNSGTYTISLSTTSAAVGGLSSTFANNIGADDTTVFTGSLPALDPGVGFTIMFSQDFSYDPGAGNLLLNVVYGGTDFGSLFLDAYGNDPETLFSRVTDFGAGTTGYGLVTGFVVAAPSAVPEPTTLALFGAGLLGLARRKRRPINADV